MNAEPRLACRDVYPTLATRRFEFRPFVLSDVGRLAALAGEHRVADTTIGIPHPYTTEFARKWISSHSSAQERCLGLHWAATKLGDDRIVGYAGLDKIDAERRQAELRFWVGCGCNEPVMQSSGPRPSSTMPCRASTWSEYMPCNWPATHSRAVSWLLSECVERGWRASASVMAVSWRIWSAGQLEDMTGSKTQNVNANGPPGRASGASRVPPVIAILLKPPNHRHEVRRRVGASIPCLETFCIHQPP